MVQSRFPASTRDVLLALFRHKKKVVATFLALAVLALLGVCLQPHVYVAEAKLLIRLGRENLSVDPSVPGPTVNPYLTRENELNSELAILTSRSLIEQVVSEMGMDALAEGDSAEPGSALEYTLGRLARGSKAAARKMLESSGLKEPLSPHDRAVVQFMRNFEARVERRTNILNASYEARSPELAQQVLSRIVSCFMDSHIQAYSTQASPEFFERQAQQQGEDLARCEAELESFKAAHGITALPRQKEILLGRVGGLEAAMEETAANADASEAKLNSLKGALAKRTPVRELARTTGRTNYAADGYKQRLAELNLQETEMAALYPETHRPLQHLREQISQLEATLADEDETLTEVTTGVDSNYEQLKLALDNEQAQWNAEIARRTALAAELAVQQQALAALAAHERELARLERNVELAERDYREYRERLQLAKVSAQLERDKVTNVSVIQSAHALPTPVRPNKPLNMIISIVAAMAAAVLVAFICEYTDQSVRSCEDVLDCDGGPVLAVVPQEDFERSMLAGRR